MADNSATEFILYVYENSKLSALDGQTYTFTTDESLAGWILVYLQDGRQFFKHLLSNRHNKSGRLDLEIVTAAEARRRVSAGTPLELLVRAADANKNIDKDYIGNHALIFSGLNPAGAYSPKIENTALGLNITIGFSSGVTATNAVTLLAYKKEISPLVVQESGMAYGQSGLALTVNSAAASALSLVSGNNQTGRTSLQLAQSFIAGVSDTYGNAGGAGTGVDFAIFSQPSGATGTILSTLSAITDVNGQAQSGLTLGSAAGIYQVTASSAGLSGSPLTFSATGLLPSAIQAVSGNNQSAQAGIALAAPLAVKVVDSFGTAIANEAVAFAISNYPLGSTGQALSVSSALTDSSGQASVALTLGNKAGDYKVAITSGALPALEFTATATAAAAYKVVLSGPVAVKAGEVSTVWTVLIQDEFGNNVNLTSSTGFSLTTNPARPGAGFYANADGSGAISSLIIAAGANSASFYYKDSAVGSANVTAAYSGGQSLTVSSSVQSLTILPADAYRFTVTGAAGSIISAGTKSLTITAYDNQGNLKTDYSGAVNMIFSGANLSPAPAARKPTCVDKNGLDIDFGQSAALTFTNGLAATTAKLYKAETVLLKAASGAVITADVDGLGFIVQHGLADHLKFAANLPSSQAAGTEFNFGTTLNAVDLSDNICDGVKGAAAFSGSYLSSWSLSGVSKAPDGSAIDQLISPVSFTAGASTTLLKATLYRAQSTTLIAATVGLTGANIASNSITVNAGVVAKLRFSQQPSSNSITAQALSQQPKVAVADYYGNPVSSSSATISLAASTDTLVFTPVTNGALSSASGLAASIVNGEAVFSGLTYNYPENIYLRAAVSGLDLTAVYSSQITWTTAAEAAVSAGALVEPVVVSSLANSLTAKVDTLDFKITDAGADGFAAKIKQVVVKRNAAVDTTAGWSAYIEGAYITDGITQTLGVVENDQITFGSGGSVIYSLSNNTNKTFTLSVFLKAALPAGADAKVLAFKVDPAVNIALDPVSSRFSPGSVLTSSPAISVLATNFILSGTAALNAGGSQIITVKAADALGNIDQDYAGDKALVFSGAGVSLKGNNPTATSYAGTEIAFGTPTTVSFAASQNSLL